MWEMFAGSYRKLWEWTVDNTSEKPMKAGIRGISSYSKTFSYCFDIHLAATLLQNGDNLCKTLQDTQLSSVHAQRISCNTASTLESLQTDKICKEKVKKFAKAHNVSEPSLPCKGNPQMVIENYFSIITPDHPQTQRGRL